MIANCHSCYYETLEGMDVRNDRLIKNFLQLITTAQVRFLVLKSPLHMQWGLALLICLGNFMKFLGLHICRTIYIYMYIHTYIHIQFLWLCNVLKTLIQALLIELVFVYMYSISI
jgi:hypothetical protein